MNETLSQPMKCTLFIVATADIIGFAEDKPTVSRTNKGSSV